MTRSPNGPTKRQERLSSHPRWGAFSTMKSFGNLPAPETVSDHGELLRTIGFSSAPGILPIFGPVPPIAGLVFVVSTLWMLVAMVVAVRQALDYDSTLRAIAVCAFGFPVYAIILGITLLLMGPWPI